MGLLFQVGHEWPNDSLPPWCPYSKAEVAYYMNMARAVKEAENPCPSRQIGVVIVDPRTGALVSTGHNGPPDGCPPNDDEEYLGKVFWPQLKANEKRTALSKTMNPEEVQEMTDADLDEQLPIFLMCQAGCGTVCPRKLIDAPSGQRLELCSCAHGETNAIIRAHRSVAGCWMFCFCGVPCIDCTKLIINSRIYTVAVVDHGRGDYSPYSSRWLFAHSKTNLLFLSEKWLEDKCRS